ncbi:MAG: DNA double-strand break repair nuclease NurA [Desulfurococcaceae archaeon]
MKYLASLIDDLKKRVANGSRVVKEDSSVKPIEIIDDVAPRQIEVLEEPAIKQAQIKTSLPIEDIFALDTSSRVIETPYVFIGIGAGSVYSRLTGRGFDAPHAASILGLEKPLCNHVVVIPEIELEQDFTNKISSMSGVLASNPIGIPYTSGYSKHVVLMELRLMIELCLMKTFLNSNYATPGSTLLIDGPITYPFYFPAETSLTWSRDKLKTYSDSLEFLNSERVKIVDRLMKQGVLVVGIVKRLVKSYYLSSVDPAKLSVGRINDEAYIMMLLLRVNKTLEKPFIIGPIRVKHETSNITRLMWYIVVPRRIYPITSGMGNFVSYRVELLENNSHRKDYVLEQIFYDSFHTGSLLPLSLLVVDRRVKKVTSSMVTYLLYMTGLTEESTGQYISVL